MIPARYEYVTIWRTYRKYRKEMACGMLFGAEENIFFTLYI